MKRTLHFLIVAMTSAVMLPFAVTTSATAQVGNTLRYEIEHYAGGIGCVYVTGYVYDSDPVTKWWQAGVGKEIEVYGVLSTTREENDEDYERYLEDAECFVMDDVNQAYGLTGYHGFRIMFNLDTYRDWYDNQEETTLWVRVYAAVKDGSAPASELDDYGRIHILLGDPIEVPNVKWPDWEEPHVTKKTNEIDGWDLYTGFTTTNDRWRNLVDGDFSTYISNDYSYVDFESDEVIIPVAIWFNTMDKNLNPASWNIQAKLHKEDEWTVLISRDWPYNNRYNLGLVPFDIPHESNRGYRYFSFGARPRENGNYRYYLREIRLSAYCYKHLLPRLATCSQVGIIRECYQLDKDGKYFADDAATIEYNASDVEVPKKNHEGVPYGNTGCWQCRMCRNYFSDEACTTPQPTWSVTLPEQMELINDAVYDADPNGKYVHGTVIEFKAKDIYKGYISNVKNGETELTANQDGVYTLTVGDADVVVSAKVDLLVLADNADNADAIRAFSGKQPVVKLKGRTLYKDGLWNTLCLPFTLNSLMGTPIEGATVKTLESTKLENNKLTLNFTDATNTIQAGKPYLIRWDKANGYDEANPNERDLKDPTFRDITIPEYDDSTMNVAQVYFDARCQSDYVDFVGTYSPLKFTSEDKSILILSTLVLGEIYTSFLSYPKENAFIGNGRGYFLLKGIRYEAASQIKEFVLNTGEDDADGIGEIKNEKLKKENEGDWFDLSGRKFAGKPTQKGVYIVNGKKIIK